MTNPQITTQSLDTLKDEELLVFQELLHRNTPYIDEDLANETLQSFCQLDDAINGRFSATATDTKTTHKRAA